LSKPRIAISIGDLNGIGIEIAIEAHKTISKICKPIYCVDKDMLKQACKLLHVEYDKSMKCVPIEESFKITPSKVRKKSGHYSFYSFLKAINLAEDGEVDAIVTLPIHKEAWSKAGLSYVGHTDYLREHFKQNAIMMLGCEKLFVALYTEHTPLKEVAKTIKAKELTTFFLNLSQSISEKKIGILGLNPHAGDNGVLGDEEKEITKAIKAANKAQGKTEFFGPLVPDTAFTPHALSTCNRLVAMYHDQGLAPLKALYFDESINVSLNLPIIRTSVDHGTAFDIAYTRKAKSKSYINAIISAISFMR